MSERIKVVVTGAAGQIAYSLIPRLVDGKTFGNRTVDLCLVEIPQVVSKLKGLVMELEDSYFPHMGEVTYTDNFPKQQVDVHNCTYRMCTLTDLHEQIHSHLTTTLPTFAG